MSCSNQKIIGNEYIAKTENRELILRILDKNELEIVNTFDCDNLSEDYKTITFRKNYYLRKNKIVLENSNFEINLPFVNESNCFFLSKSYRESKNTRAIDGKLIIRNREDLYTIGNIDKLIIQDNKLIFYKNIDLGSVGYIFKLNK